MIFCEDESDYSDNCEPSAEADEGAAIDWGVFEDEVGAIRKNETNASKGNSE